MRRILPAVLSATLVCGVGLVSGLGASTASATTKPACGPGSYDDTDSVVSIINGTINRAISPITMAVKQAHIAPGGSKTIVKTIPGGLEQIILNRSADGQTYDFEVDVALASATPSWTEVGSGDVTDHGVVAGVRTIDSAISVDFNALQSVITTSKPTGSFSATIELVKDPTKPGNGTKTTTNVTFTDITVRASDPHGPRSGTYTHVLEGGVGGDYDFSGTIPVPCPGGAAGPAVNISVQREHRDTGAMERTFRRDAVATGYLLPAGDQAIAFECGNRTTTNLPEYYLLTKIENADGSSATYHITYRNETSPQCDPLFGSLVSPTDNTTDWTFVHPLTFPGEW
jgi:hypothetical protein